MIVAVPADIPLTIPAPARTVATEGLLLVHMPPDVVWLNVVVDPVHADVAPVIADGVALTVSVIVRTQPVESI